MPAMNGLGAARVLKRVLPKLDQASRLLEKACAVAYRIAA